VSSASSVSKLLAAFFSLILSTGATAAEFTFAAFGDTPYSRDEEARFPGLIAEMNREQLDFVVHIGDFKEARSYCTDDLYRQRREWFNAFRHPFVFVPGDNEWTDCRRLGGGRYVPMERLGKLRELFFSGTESLGQRRITLTRQPSGYPEHARWRHNDVLFATLNVPGGANNARDDPAEFRTRSIAVMQWLRDSFRIAREEKLPAIAIFMHANPWASPTGRYFGYRELLVALDTEVRGFPGAVLLVHGDTHRYRVDQPPIHPDGGAAPANFTRVEVFGYPTMNWVRIRVSEDAKRVRFEVTPGS
jgi:predicted phosphodiesterase